ncbi:MAG: hypothetical protein K6B72_09490 [Lachnospiraceae bacterium]|nr:hypothetical protein [Lachnospiraceae bacterium]
MKKKTLVLLGLIMALAVMTGCGEEKKAPEKTETQEVTDEIKEDAPAEPEEEEAEEEPNVGMANPWVDITEEEAGELVTRLFKVPDGADSLGWMKCEELGDPERYISPMVQLSFYYDGQVFTARAQQGAAEDTDISGLYYTWTDGPNEVTLANWGGGNMTGKTYRSINEAGMIDLITWYDIEIGISYSLSVAAVDLSGFDIQAVAEQMYAGENELFEDIPDDEGEQSGTEDGVYGTHLWSSEKDRIGTTDSAGVFYSVVYEVGLSGNELSVTGSMSYKNSAEQDPLFVSDDETHVFTLGGDTVYQLLGGSGGPEIITVDEFYKDLNDYLDTGLYLEIEVNGGIVTSASLSA